MSGGVDSSVAAASLLASGHTVTGVTLRLWGGESDSGCCSVGDVEDARQVAAQLGIDHHVFNMSDEFEEHVVRPYVDDHAAGLTPNPCVECNRHLKFDALLSAAHRLGFDRLATGHHARVRASGSRADLCRGVDDAKDQSYVLSMLTAEQLSSILLPVGEMTKDEVRRLATDLGLETAGKPESQDTCFISSTIGRRGFLDQRTTLHPGRVIDRDSGADLGTVDAVELVTVGQRRGLGVDADGTRRVAVAVDTVARTVAVASPDRSLVDEVRIDPSTQTWTGAPIEEGHDVLVQLRAHAPSVAARFTAGRLILAGPIDPVAPGQTAAFYDVADPVVVRGSAVVAR